MPMSIKDVAPKPFLLFGNPSSPRHVFRIAILSEGFLPDEMWSFRVASLKVVKEVLATQPFRRRRRRLVIFRIDCQSRASARQLLKQTAAPDAYEDQTPFDVRFDMTIERQLNGNGDAVREVLDAVPGLPPIDAALVILNSTLDGGSAPGNAGWLTLNNVGPIFVHELGHSGFGLADEYDYRVDPGEAPRPYPGGLEPAEPNVTVQTEREKIPWRNLFRPADIRIKNTVEGPCKIDQAIKPGTPSDAVGLFEGADQHACNVYRPSATCKMRDDADEFCLVCDQVIDRKLAGAVIDTKPPVTVAADFWTHAAAVPPAPSSPDSFDIAAYNALSGWFAIYPADNLDGRMAQAARPLGPTDIGRGFTTVCAFPVGAEKYVYLDNFLTDRRLIYRIDTVGMLLPGKPCLAFHHEQPAQVPPQFGYSHVLAFQVRGDTYLLHYDRVSGALELEIFDTVTGALPFTVASTRAGSLRAWHPFLSTLTIVTVGGSAHLVGISMIDRTVRLARIVIPSGPLPMSMLADTWSSGLGFLLPGETHALGFSHHRNPTLLTYSSLDGHACLYEVRAGGAGIDFVFGWPLTPGAVALYDVGLPAFGYMSRSPNGPARPSVDHLWFYNSGLRRFTTTLMR